MRARFEERTREHPTVVLPPSADEYEYTWAGLPVTALVEWWQDQGPWVYVLLGFLAGLIVACAAFLFGVLLSYS